MLNADRITVTDSDSIPTGQFRNVSGTNYDFRFARNLGQAINVQNVGFDNNFCVNQCPRRGLGFVAR